MALTRLGLCIPASTHHPLHNGKADHVTHGYWMSKAITVAPSPTNSPDPGSPAAGHERNVQVALHGVEVMHQCLHAQGISPQLPDFVATSIIGSSHQMYESM